MLFHHLTIAWRNLRKQPIYSFINIIGLTVGLLCALFILLFVKDELSYDRYHEHADNIYRLTSHGQMMDTEFDFATVGGPTAEAMVQDYPEVINALRFQSGIYIVSNRERNISFTEEHVAFTDSSLFDMFSFKLLEGDPKTALTRPNTMVITAALARKYFGEENPIGKTLRLDNNSDYEVSGVMEEMPRNSHFHFDIFLSFSTQNPDFYAQWTSFNYQTYLLLAPGADPNQLEAKLPGMVEKYIGPEIEQYIGATITEFEEQGNHIGFALQKMTDIHLYSDLEDELGANSDAKYIRIFSLIGILILVIACINFMNLATARYAGRAREIGVKKVVGALRGQLIRQFLLESILFSLIALILAFGLALLLLPGFNVLADKELTLSQLSSGPFLFGLLGVATLTGLIAGSYPAFFLSGFKPVSVLKGTLRMGKGGSRLRSALVVGQFVTTLCLILGTLVMFKQMRYIQNKKLGFDKENVVILHYAYLLQDQNQAFKQEMLTYPEVLNASISGYLPTRNLNNGTAYWIGSTSPNASNTFVLNNWRVDDDYLPTMGLEIKEGRNFSQEYGTDSVAILVNEALVKFQGWENPLGQLIKDFPDENEQPVAYKIVGVFKDFHYESLRNKIRPLILHRGESRGLISFRIRPNSVETFLEHLEEQWGQFAPGQPFEYSFLDERFDRIYESETRLGKVFALFSSIAVLIACLGLLGLAAFSAEKRTREMGIRKILGASVGQLVLLIYKDFGKLVGIALLVGFPLATFLIYKWLEGFEYRTQPDIWSFGLAALLVLGLAGFTLIFQALKAAGTQPAEALKYE